jgi:predicted CoA-binding protein
MEPFPNPDDDSIRGLLGRVRRIAVVGLSPKPHRDSHRVARYLLERGYEIVPVHPREERILGQSVYRRVQDVPGPVDLVDVFRRSQALPEVIDDALAARASALWLQLGCVDEAGARRAREAGMTVVMDRCLMVEHARLLGRQWVRT